MTKNVQRRLAAILAADVVGYSRLMGEDEAGTLAVLNKHRRETFDPEVARHGGRVVKIMGDGTLVEFPSVVNAVKAALAILGAKVNDTQIKLRIGINLGDVIIDGDDIYGDGVNIAARLESLAEPGGLCISSAVRESLGNRVDACFADAGEHVVKNIARPIRVFRWPDREAIGEARKDLVPPELLRERTISVDPFHKLSDDAELGYLCEGIVDDIITAFGNIEQLTVVTDQHRLAGQGGANIGKGSVHYLLTGKARQSGGRIRVTAKLVDRLSGVQLWVKRYDRDAGDLFELQDDIARNIVIGVHTALGAGSYTNRWQWGTEDFEAWQLMAKGFHEFQKFSPESLMKAAALWEQALAIDPDYLAPLLASAYAYGHLAFIAEPDEAQRLVEKAQAAIDRAVVEAPEDIRQYAGKRAIAFAQGDAEAAVAAAERAYELAPNDSYTRATLGHALTCAGRAEEALTHITMALRDMPNPPGWMAMSNVLCLFVLGEYSKAMRIGRETLARQPDLYPVPPLIAALAAELDLPEETAAMRDLTLRTDPRFGAEMFVKWVGLTKSEHLERLSASLKAACFTR